jgi:hypothetical protein
MTPPAGGLMFRLSGPFERAVSGPGLLCADITAELKTKKPAGQVFFSLHPFK